MFKRYYIAAFLGAVVLLPLLVFGLVKWYQNGYAALPVLGPEHHVLSDYQLTNQYGAVRTLENAENKLTINHFFFTHCPSICPRMMRNLKNLQAVFGRDSTLLINSFTVDPERDTVGQLSQYATRLGISGNWQLLTGNKKILYRLARKSFMVVATDGDGGPEDFIHSELLVLADPQHRIRGYYKGTEEEAIKNLERDIRKLEQVKPN
ncbi:MAG: SCO family protein [Flavisolibacter sp.]